MWIIIFLGCFSVLFPCQTQEIIKSDAQIVAETPPSNEGVDWDSTGPPVTLSITDGGSDATNRPQYEVSDHPPFYSNQWQPFLMPIGFNHYGDQYAHNADIEDSMDPHSMPTFLRRPDSDLNRTSFSHYMHPFNTLRNQYSPVPVPMAPIAPMIFYPQQPNLYSDGNTHATNINLLQNSSTSDTEASHSKEETGEILPPPHIAMLPGIRERFVPINFHRDTQSFRPSIPAFVPPYPILPYADSALHPAVNPYVNGHVFDREAGSVATANVHKTLDVPVTEASVTSVNMSDREASVIKGTSSESTPILVPSAPLPLPIGGFPFRVLPPPILPTIIPNPAATTGLPFNPLLEPLSFHNEYKDTNAIPPPSQLSPGLPLESASSVLPPINALQPEVEVSANMQTDAEKILPDENPNAAKIPYEFGFDMNDGKGTDQHRKEVSDVSGTVRGSYGYRDMFGVYRFVNYIADKNGFRAFIKSNEPGVASSGSADVVVMAERPPPQAVAEGEKAIEPKVIVVPDGATDLIAEGSGTESK